MPVPDIHPLFEVPVPTTTASVVAAQTATVYAPFTGRLTSIAATTGATVGTAAAVLGLTVAGVAATGTLTVPQGTVAGVNTSGGINAACMQGDPVVLTWSGTATAGGPVGITAYFRRGG
jgi:hypothetical protein